MVPSTRNSKVVTKPGPKGHEEAAVIRIRKSCLRRNCGLDWNIMESLRGDDIDISQE